MQCLGKRIFLTGNLFSSNLYVIKEVAVMLEVGDTPKRRFLPTRLHDIRTQITTT